MTLWGGRSLVSETLTLSQFFCLVVLLTSMIHMWRSLSLSMSGRPLLVSILDQEGVREETQAGVLRPGLPPGPLGSRQELSPPTALQSPFVMACAPYDEGCVNTSARKPAQVLQMSAQRLCKQGPSLWSVFALLKKG